ncbi:MAG: gliding motility-associated C-terminal domain-containing protein [Flavobacteriales bacterium]|nr:gliding motility-associated C-terminal domain-containing protein [Flavobacteriales bacterium]MBK6755237.1 gliding motility-associated C-terminal domain-containing protein [Flavobacteriales bacterium]MBK9075239.1 gliding motility-associated C-terminal domain-containing protein [Flavobacteriales bacterium]
MHRKLLALVALSTLSWNVAKATHVAGGEIIYECLGNGQYQFSLILYRDCAGTTLGTSYTLDFTSPCGNQSLTVDVDTVFEVSQLCEDQLPFSSCNGGNLPGLEQHVFTGTITLPPCDFWTASWSLCCRNDAISNLQTPGTYDGYLETSMNNEDYPCDNSPVFTNAPIPYVCLNQPVVYSYGVYDPDGDSLSYALISAMTTGGVPIPYVFPYTFLEPIQAGLTFDPFTGLLQFTPNAIGNYVVVMEVTQYDDDGNVIGTTLRDMQFVVIACTNQAPDPTAGAIDNFSGTAVQTGPFSIELCESDNFCFEATFTDPDAGDTLTFSSNIQQNLPGSTISATGANPLTITVCWTAQAGNSGFFPFTITVEDGNCPISAFQTFVYATNVLQRTSVGPDQTICGPQIAEIEAQGGLNFVWTIIPGGDPITGQNFTCLDPPFCSEVIADPNSTTSYIVTSDLAGTCINADTVTVFVVSDFTFAATQSDDTLCLGETAQLNVVPNPNLPGYTFEWIPTLGLSAGDIANPIAGYSQPGSYAYTVEITSPDGCVKQDTTLGLVVLPGFVPDFTLTVADSSFCEGQGTTFTVDIDNSPPIYCGPNFAGCTSGIVADFELGTGVDQGTTTSYPAPYGNWYNSTRHQVLVRASELLALGFTGGTINELSMNIAVVNGLSLYPGWSIQMGCTTLDSLDINDGFVSGLTQVFGPTDVNILAGWNSYVLNPGFNWDGVSNVVVEFCFSNYPNGFTQNSPTFYTTTSYTSVIYNFTDGANLCDTVTPPFFNQGESNQRPNMRFRVCAGVNEDLLVYSWSPTDGLSDPNGPVTNVVPIVTPAVYTVTVGDPNLGCFGTATATTYWDPPADVSFVPLPTNEGVAPFVVSFDNTSSGNVTSFTWTFGDSTGTSNEFEPGYTFEAAGTYVVTLYGVSDQGCTGFYQDTIVVLPDPVVDIPNVFSPNGDGDNDAFIYRDLRGFKQVEMTIFNRWGQKVHEAPVTADNGTIWRPETSVAEGTYFYVFIGQGNDGSEVKREGHVTLVR